MPDREKVIKAIECRKNAHKRCGNPCEMTGLCAYASQVRSPDGEPYYPFYCDTERLCDDVLALLRQDEPVTLKSEELLKEQEPKVLTHDEAIVLPEGTPVWFEESTDAGQTFISPMICHGNGLYGNRFMQVDAKQLYWHGRRFWTAKPNDDQRKAVKWDELER